MARSQINSAALNREVKYNPEVTRALDSLGRQIAADAARLAPKRTGVGARSITHELGYDSAGPWVHVSWDRRHFYMQFAELGTEKQKPTPFLRPASLMKRVV